MSGWISLNTLGIAVTASMVAALPIIADAGDFEKLSRRDQIIARALVEAQRADAAAPSLAPLTLDDLAALKLQGRGWTSILRELESRGLIREKQLGRVASRFVQPRRTRLPSSVASAPVKNDRTRMVQDEARQERSVSPGEAPPLDHARAAMNGDRNR